MKFDVSQIIRDYLKVLIGERFTRVSLFDLFVVFGIPTAASVSSFWMITSVDKNLYISLFTLLGVFVAVFITIFGVLVPVYNSPRRTSVDPDVDARYVSEDKIRRKVISELGSSMSYLMLFSILAMAFLMIPISTNTELFLFKWTSVFIGTHLLVNLLVIMKRLHALFQYEFR